MNKPEFYLRLALDQAQLAVKQGHRPYGAVIVNPQGQVISQAYNTVHASHDATNHAEVSALRLASKYQNTHKLRGFSLYSTAEPCLMCMGAAVWFRIEKVYFGIDLEELEQLGFEQIRIPSQEIAQQAPWPIEIYPHILHQEVFRFYSQCALDLKSSK